MRCAPAHFDLRLWQTAPDGKRSLAAQRRVVLSAGANRVELPVHVDRPQRWFPNGYGAQPLYRYELEIGDGKAAIATAGARTGLRSIVLRREADAKGRSFYFTPSTASRCSPRAPTPSPSTCSSRG
jgi:beta-mannosidase